jgi:hypothetical protein
LLFVRGRPPSASDRLASEVNYRVRAVDLAGPHARIAVRQPDDLARRELGRGSSREDDNVVTLSDEALGKRPAEKAGTARDDDFHLKNPYHGSGARAG